MAVSDFTAHVMIRNESYWIGYVLAPVLQVFPHVLVADTGSEDGSTDILRVLQTKHTNLEVWYLGKLSPEENGDLRTKMLAAVPTTWGFQIDGDEIYPPETLRKILEIGMPIGKHSGFTCLHEIAENEHGLYRTVPFSAFRILRKGMGYRGPYPWEYSLTVNDPEGFYYFPGELCGWHVHGLQRSPLDATTYLRLDKKHHIPVIEQPFALPFVETIGKQSWPNPYIP